MSGKVGSAIAAVALSSASVSAVGIVYTGVISVRYEFSGASNRIEGFGRAAPSPSSSYLRTSNCPSSATRYPFQQSGTAGETTFTAPASRRNSSDWSPISSK